VVGKKLVATRGGSATSGPVSVEAPVTLVVNDRELATLLCTPGDLRDLAVGWLLAEGVIEGPREIVSLAGCANDSELLICTSPDRTAALGERWRIVASGCGADAHAGTIRVADVPCVGVGLRLSLTRLRELALGMLRGATLYHKTGGVHAAALATPEALAVIREDIGRHNAVDKVIGRALLEAFPLHDMLLLSTGRLSSEMVWKAARAGLQLAASVSIPSTLACDLAESAGLTLVGRVVSAHPWVYTHKERLSDE
jgi:FdhD protein